MSEIIICEDNDVQRKQLYKIIENYSLAMEYDFKIILSTSNPNEVINFIKEKKTQNGVYFLDVELNHDLTGFNLGSLIRKLDPQATIIMVTAHGELSRHVFEYKVEAMDYILKEDPSKMVNKITECLDTIVTRRLIQTKLEEDVFQVKSDNGIRFFRVEDVLYFSTTEKPHRILLHLKNSTIEFYGNLKEIEKRHTAFYRCNTSHVVNLFNVKEIKTKERIIKLITNQELDVSVRRKKGLLEKVEEVKKFFSLD